MKYIQNPNDKQEAEPLSIAEQDTETLVNLEELEKMHEHDNHVLSDGNNSTSKIKLIAIIFASVLLFIIILLYVWGLFLNS